MNENLQNAIQQLITKSLDGVDTSVDFLQAELPDYVYQLLLWYGWYHFLLFLISVASVPVLITLDKKAHGYMSGKLKEGDISESDYQLGYYVVGTLVRAIAWLVLFILPLNLKWLQIWIAPKTWLVEYASYLAR